MQRPDPEAGFTLVETLVAFAILASALVVVFDVFGTGLHNLSGTQEQKRLMTIARAEIDRLVIEPYLTEAVRTGSTGGIDWELRVSALGVNDNQNFYQWHPFKVTFHRLKAGDPAATPPVLETILLARLPP